MRLYVLNQTTLTTNAAPRQPVVTTDMPVSDIDVPDSAAQKYVQPHQHPPRLECTARVYNINYGHNQELMASMPDFRGNIPF